MLDVVFRCSSIGKLMTEPKSKSEGPLSVGAKSYIRSLVAQEIFGVEFEFSSKQTTKGTEVEQESLEMLNRVRGLQLVKNPERRTRNGLTGECDAFDVARRCGHDVKSPWSLATFPAFVADAHDKLYEWQMRGYMALWDASCWEVNYCMVDTPDNLIGYESLELHLVSHIPEHLRVTTWVVERDAALERQIFEKLAYAKAYFLECIQEFDRQHQTCPVQQAASTARPAEAQTIAAKAIARAADSAQGRVPAPPTASPKLPELF